MKIFLVMLVLSVIQTTAFANGPWARTTSDPMKYAEQVSKSYAEGDANDSSGWQGCQYALLDPENPLLDIECEGTAQLLMHGGHWVHSNFSCSFSFAEDNTSTTDYFIATESCYYY
jgi:hypothetical protein